jgi:hypothetical protein
VVVFSARDVLNAPWTSRIVGEVNMLSGIGFDNSLVIDDNLNGVVVGELDLSDEPSVLFSVVFSVLELIPGGITSGVVVDVIFLLEMDE